MDALNNYQKLREKQLPPKPVSDNPENRFWNSYKQVIEKSYEASVKSIYATTNTKNKIAISFGKGIEIFSTSKNQITQTLKRFQHPALTVALRSDSHLLASGHEDGFIQVMNLKTKTQLRAFKNFKKPVYCVNFAHNIEHLYAASDDGTVKLFNVPMDSVTRSIPHAHEDFIRSIQPLQDGTLLTSSYDKTVKLFDFRSNNEPIRVFRAKHPIESILTIPNTFTFVSAEDCLTSLWDLRKDRVAELQSNQKTVTALGLSLYHDQLRVVTGSLDHQIKYIRTDLFQVTHQQKWASPVLSLDATEDGCNLAVGGVDGRLEILQNKHSKEEDECGQDEEDDGIPKYLKQNPHLQRTIRNYKFYNRGIHAKIENYDFKVQSLQQQKFTGYDKLLVQFKYKEAMLKAFKDKQTAMILSLYEELADRGALDVAFSNLEQKELDEVLGFIFAKMSNPKFSQVMLAILDRLIDTYKDGIVSDELLRNLQSEADLQNQLQKLSGILQVYVAH